MAEQPVAYFLTFGTYGSRLHGDSRGTVSRGANTMGTPHLRRDDLRRSYEERLMTSTRFLLDRRGRRAIEAAVAETCRIRGWAILALHVRMTHIHLVVAAPGVSPETALQALKANATRVLRSQQLVGESDRVWARHGSTRYLWHDRDVDAAINYTMTQQGDDLPGSDPDAWTDISSLNS